MFRHVHEVATILLTVPDWCRSGLAADSRYQREQAAAELARILVADQHPADVRQIALPL